MKQSVDGIGIGDFPSGGWSWNANLNLFTDTTCKSMFSKLFERLEYADTYAKQNNIKFIPIAILWHQGEHDVLRNIRTSYKENMTNIINFMRGYLNAPYIPFIAGQLIIAGQYDGDETTGFIFGNKVLGSLLMRYRISESLI